MKRVVPHVENVLDLPLADDLSTACRARSSTYAYAAPACGEH